MQILQNNPMVVTQNSRIEIIIPTIITKSITTRPISVCLHRIRELESPKPSSLLQILCKQFVSPQIAFTDTSSSIRHSFFEMFTCDLGYRIFHFHIFFARFLCSSFTLNVKGDGLFDGHFGGSLADAAE